MTDTLRDRIAMAALQGMLAKEYGGDLTVLDLAADAYDYADAMLKVRERPAREFKDE